MTTNVYDFDKTIYDGDSSIDFFIFCLLRHPSMMLDLPLFIINVTSFKLGNIDDVKMKESFFTFLKRIPDVDKYVELFWVKHKHKIKAWYWENKRSNDIIISASPFFLLDYICKRLNVELIASIIDKHTGIFNGRNCKGYEKVILLKKKYPDIVINKFYSDSLSDSPLASLAKEAFIVKGENIERWQIS